MQFCCPLVDTINFHTNYLNLKIYLFFFLEEAFLPLFEMPRSFLVKRGGLHLLRHAAGSPASSQTERSQLEEKSWGGSLRCSTDEKSIRAPPASSISEGDALLQTLPHKGENQKLFRPSPQRFFFLFCLCFLRV